MRVRIIIDSTADVIPEVKKRVSIVPLTVHFGQEEFIDGVTITHKEFYEKLVESDVLPSTSQATPDAFTQVFEEVAQAGESAVVLTLSANFSGTYQSAMIAAEGYDNIYVVDSETAAIGTGILTELALHLADSGMDARAIAKKLEQEKKNVRIIAMMDTLEYLQKGGRVSKTVAFAGGLLNIKPVIFVAGGQITMIGKARGAKLSNQLLTAEINKAGGVDFSKPVLLGYTGLTDVYLQKYIEDSKYLWEAGASELHSTVVGSVIGTHAGPGAIAAAFFKKN